jgi:hypothetical protein
MEFSNGILMPSITSHHLSSIKDAYRAVT